MQVCQRISFNARWHINSYCCVGFETRSGPLYQVCHRGVVAGALRVVRVVMAAGEVCCRKDSPAVLAPEGKLLRDAICVGVRAIIPILPLPFRPLFVTFVSLFSFRPGEINLPEEAADYGHIYEKEHCGQDKSSVAIFFLHRQTQWLKEQQLTIQMAWWPACQL